MPRPRSTHRSPPSPRGGPAEGREGTGPGLRRAVEAAWRGSRTLSGCGAGWRCFGGFARRLAHPRLLAGSPSGCERRGFNGAGLPVLRRLLPASGSEHDADARASLSHRDAPPSLRGALGALRGRGGTLLLLSLVLLLAPIPAARAWPPITDWPVQRDPLAAAAALHEVFPHVRLDRSARLVEFDAIVPINAHAPDGSVVFLEVIACRRDSKEHEALAMTDALPSHVHAALLLLDLEPGTTGGWRWEGQALIPVPPQGPGVTAWLAWQDDSGAWVEHDALDLVISRADGRTFARWLADTLAPGAEADGPDAPFAFAGSRFVERRGDEFYDADGTGLIVGLHTFSSEVVACRAVLSPEAAVLEPEWIARADLLPPRGAPVVVRLRASSP